MSFTPVALNFMSIPITFESIVLSVVTAGLLYVPIRYAAGPGFYLARLLFARLLGLRTKPMGTNTVPLKTRGSVGSATGGSGVTTGGGTPLGGGGGSLGGRGGGR